MVLKVMPWPWLSVYKQIWIKSFKWGTVCSCRSRGCKNIRDQSWRSKKNLLFQTDPGCGGFESGRVGNFFFSTSNFDLWYFAASWPTKTYITSLKDLIHICLETENQGQGMTFNITYVCLKYPYIISYRGKWVYLFCHRCTLFKFSLFMQ